MKWRKTNNTKRMDSGCKNRGSCKICEGNRTYSSRKRTQESVKALMVDTRER